MITPELWSQLAYQPIGDDPLYQELCQHLDELLGKSNWSESYQVLPQVGAVATHTVQCSLVLGTSQRQALATASSLQQAWELAFVHACVRFGVIDAQDLDTPEQNIAVITPNESISPKNQAQEHIDRLMEQLKEQGLGKEAALLVMKFGGYGRTVEESRKLYSELRALVH